MPRSRSLLLGIALLLACACGGSPPSAAKASPSPKVVHTPLPTPVPSASLGSGYAPWALNLDLSGDLTAHVTGTAAPDSIIRDECTANNSSRLGAWASTMALDIGGQRYALVVLAKNYKGAAVFSNSNVSVEVNNADSSRVWQNGPDDSVTFTVGADENSGLLDATLSNTAVPANKVRISGHWSCQP
jgi:hypothetical protein